MTLQEILKKKNARLLSVPDKFLSGVEKSQKAVLLKLISLLDRLDVTAGNIDRSIKNLNTIPGITDTLKNDLLSSEYYKQVKEFADEFDIQKRINDSYFEKIAPVKSDFADKILIDAKKATVTDLLAAPLDENFLKPIEEILTQAVSTGSSWSETLKAIQDYAIGDGEKDGKLLQYSKQIAHDAFAIADRTYSNALADETENEFYFYSGGELPTSRCFCLERHEQYFHYKEIESWGRAENLGSCRSGDLWAGANPNTNEKTIFNFAGGFNCIHTLMPVSIFDPPKDVIQRNIDNGNYSPDEITLEALG